MNYYATSALMSFFLFGLGCLILFCGIRNFILNKNSKSDQLMLILCIFSFLINFGYAWMGLCFDTDFAYSPRAIGPLSVFLYIAYYMRYISFISKYSVAKSALAIHISVILLIISFPNLIVSESVTFKKTPWGYWYSGSMSPARIIETVGITIAIVYVFEALLWGKKHAPSKREKHVLSQLLAYPVFAGGGFLLDSIIPSIFHIPALPGTCIVFSVGTLWSFYIAEKNRLLGISKENLSGYVFDDVKVPVIVTNPEDRIVLCNKYTSEYLRRNENEMCNFKINGLFKETPSNTYIAIGLESECLLERTEIIDKYGEKLFNIYFVRDITREVNNFKLLKQSKEELERMYILDPLTGVYNRRGFNQKAYELLKGKRGGFVTVFSADLDGLKQTNDNHGHSAGDFSLISLSKILTEWIGEKGIVARFGGDEFVALVYQKDMDNFFPANALNEINTKLHQIKLENKINYDIKCSLGFVIEPCTKDINLETLINKSDNALYEVKHEHHIKRKRRSKK